LPVHEDGLLRPVDEPPLAAVTFEWEAIAAEGLARREELRRQRWEVKRRELEFVASKNFLLPSLDVYGRYRWRGFGQDLTGRDGARFDSAFANLADGDFQEWQAGVELSVPLGSREGHAAVRHAELNLIRAKAVLREQERQVLQDLSSAVSEVERAYAVLQTQINREIAAKQQLDALQAAYASDKAEFFVVLDAQRRLAEAESRYFQARIEYALAMRNVHFEKGSLLDYCSVALSEDPCPTRACRENAAREDPRLQPAESYPPEGGETPTPASYPPDDAMSTSR
jgi:outer membrane protein TolC